MNSRRRRKMPKPIQNATGGPATPPTHAASTAECPTGAPAGCGPIGHPPRRTAAWMRNPRGRWRWPKSRPRGSTGRVGAGLKGPDLPRDEARFSSRRLGRNPPSGTPVTRKDAAARRDGCSPSPKCGQRYGQDPAADRSWTAPTSQIAQIPARRSLRNWPASGAATEPRADLVSSTTAKATFPWKPTNQSVRSPGRPDPSGALPTCP
jgi:hypothetical protein